MPTNTQFGITFAFIGAVAIAAATGAVGGVGYLFGNNVYRPMPRDVNISEGFAKPSELEIVVNNDIDTTEGNETSLVHNGERYFLATTDEGKLECMPYAIETTVDIKYK